MISLPRTPEFQDCAEDVNECLDDLRQLHVDVREHIRHEDLTEANQFDVVIVVAHRNASSEELVLAEGNMSINDFVSSIPTDFKGVIDFSSCYSATAFSAIKERCPQCKAQVALVETTLLRRLIIYPTLVECLYDNPTVDYGVAYKEVSKAFNDAVDEIDTDNLPMTHLGAQMTSIYAPKEVKRDSVFQIIVFFHYDFEKEEVLMSAISMEPNAIIRNRPQKISISLDEGDQITVTLRFVSTDMDNLKVENNEYEKAIAVRKELMIESFAVLVLPNYHANSFRAEIVMAKDEKPFVRCPFTIYIAEQENKAPADFSIEIPINDVRPAFQIGIVELFDKYLHIFNDKIYIIIRRNLSTEEKKKYKSIFDNGIIENFETIPKNKGYDIDGKMFAARKFVFDRSNVLFEKIIGHINDYIIIGKGNDNIAKEINKSYNKLKRNAEKLDRLLMKFKYNGKEIVRFEDIDAHEFAKIEIDFLNLVSDVIYLDGQVYLLDMYNKLKERMDICKTIKNTKENREKKSLLVGKIQDTADYFFDVVVKGGIDKELFEIFSKKANTSIVQPYNSSHVTASFLALLLAMARQKCNVIKRSQKDWEINVLEYMQDVSAPTLKRITDVISLLNDKSVREYVDNYNNGKDNRISISQNYILGIKDSSIF